MIGTIHSIVSKVVSSVKAPILGVKKMTKKVHGKKKCAGCCKGRKHKCN